MNKIISSPNHRTSLPLIGMKVLSLLIFTIGCVWILMPGKRDVSIALTPWIILASLLAVLFFAEPGYTRKTILVFITITFTGYFIEVIGVNTGLIFGSYCYGETLGISFFNTPLLIGINWLFLVYASASVFERFTMPLIVKIVLASLVMLIYDMIVEPIADKMDMWQWMNATIPVQNYIAWFVIAFLFHSLIKWSGVSTRNSLAPWMLLCQFLFFTSLRLFLK